MARKVDLKMKEREMIIAIKIQYLPLPASVPAHLLSSLPELEIETNVGLAGTVRSLLPGPPHHEDGPGDPGHHVTRHPAPLRCSVSWHVTLPSPAVLAHHSTQLWLRADDELQLYPALVLRVDLQHLALGSIVRLTKHEGVTALGEQFLHCTVGLETRVLHQNILDDGLQSNGVRLENISVKIISPGERRVERCCATASQE